MNSTLYGETERTKNAKTHGECPIWGNERLQETVIMSVFELFRYQNVEIHK